MSEVRMEIYRNFRSQVHQVCLHSSSKILYLCIYTTMILHSCNSFEVPETTYKNGGVRGSHHSDSSIDLDSSDGDQHARFMLVASEAMPGYSGRWNTTGNKAKLLPSAAKGLPTSGSSSTHMFSTSSSTSSTTLTTPVTVGTEVFVWTNPNFGEGGGYYGSLRAPAPHQGCLQFSATFQNNVHSISIKWNVDDAAANRVVCGRVVIWTSPGCTGTGFYWEIPGGWGSANAFKFDYPDTNHGSLTGEYANFQSINCDATATTRTRLPSVTVPSPWSRNPDASVFVKSASSASTLKAWSSKEGSFDTGAAIALDSYPNGYDGNIGGSWYVAPARYSGFYTLRQADGAYCLDAGGASLAGAAIRQKACSSSGVGNSYQMWNPVRSLAVSSASSSGAVQWQSMDSLLCLQPHTAGTLLTVQPCTPTTTPISSSSVLVQLWVAFTALPQPVASPTGLSFPSSSTAVISRLNALSRHSSWGAASALASAVDWRSALGTAKDQRGCASCWAFATTASLESLYARLTASKLSLAEQQLLDCRSSSPGTCAGGWPSQALQWVALNPQGLASTANYGSYTSGSTLKLGTCRLEVPASVRLARFEWVPALAEPAFMAAVSQQPVITYITLSNAFKAWKTWDIFRDSLGECATDSQLTHVLLLVGYGGTPGSATSPPFWIVRNSFGTAWGSSGYARVARTGGRGVCGITALPGLYPVLTRSAGSGCKAPNPCGRGTCVQGSGSASYTCTSCPQGYVVAKNSDGTQTCALVSVCTGGGVSLNPCGAGQCVNEGTGYYHCLCFRGYVPGQRADGSPYCTVPDSAASTASATAASSAVLTWYSVRAGDYCYAISTAFGLTLQQLLRQNPVGPTQKLCSPLFVGKLLNVTNSVGKSCKVLYSIQQGDSCYNIEMLFGLPVGSLAATLNPGLICLPMTIEGLPAGIQPGQQACIVQGQPDKSKVCNKLYTVTAADVATKKCSGIYTKNAVNPLDFFEINRGINCANLFVGQQACVGFQLGGPGGCRTRYSYKWQRGDTCSSVLSKFCGISPKMNWRRCFRQYPVCLGRGPAVSTRVCRNRCRGASGRLVSNCGPG